MRAVKGAAGQLANCHDAKVVKETIKVIQTDVENATKDFKRSMEVLGAETFTGIKTVSFPLSAAVLSKLLPLEFAQSVTVGATGLAVGAIAGIASYKQKGKRLSKEHEFSYLVHADHSFPKTTDGISVSRRLYRDLHEFIND